MVREVPAPSAYSKTASRRPLSSFSRESCGIRSTTWPPVGVVPANPGSRRVSGEVNGGEHELKIVTVNGDVELARLNGAH